MSREILDDYASAAAQLIPVFEAISSDAVLRPVSDVFDDGLRLILDVGAGTGRDAAWLAARGLDVVAVEPVEPLRAAGKRLHSTSRIQWIDDSLPHLAQVIETGRVFDLVLLTGVWQHIRPDERRIAMENLRQLVRVGGRVLMSVRHGPGAATRPCFPTTDAQTIDLAAQCGLSLLASRHAESIQEGNRAAGVTWTWLVLSAPPHEPAAG